jgi:hypothetical protein
MIESEELSSFSNSIIAAYDNLILTGILSCAEENQTLKSNDEFSSFVLSNRKSILRLLQNLNYKEILKNNFVDNFVSVIYKQFPYTESFLATNEVISNIYADFLDSLEEILKKVSLSNMTIKQILIDSMNTHCQKILQIINQLNINITNSHPAYSDYSADLQLKVLSLDCDNLIGPILDIGCGQNANLVHFLKKLGYRAVGLDRNITEMAEDFYSEDWFDFDYKISYWGTIISQMAFSSHFIFNHLYTAGKPEEYAKLYMRILASLQSNGIFCYTPGLPFIEDHLPPHKYQVIKHEIDLSFLRDNKYKEIYNEYLYSVKIIKK